MTTQHEQLYQLTQEVELRFDSAVRNRFPHAYREGGLSLRNSICGFASNVIMKCIHNKGMYPDAHMVIGSPVDTPNALPDRMRQHVIVATNEASIDPTWGQFMNLVGLDLGNAIVDEKMRGFYPPRKIAVIPRGDERVFGERFASFAMDKIPKIAKARRAMGERAVWPSDDKCAWMSEAEAFELLAGIWDPARYRTFDNEDDCELLAQQVANDIITSQQAAPSSFLPVEN